MRISWSIEHENAVDMSGRMEKGIASAWSKRQTPVMGARTPARTLDEERYAQAFSVLVSRSEEYPAMIDRLVAVASALPEGFVCFDVGAGPGKVLREWVDRRANRPGRYAAVEPNHDYVRALRAVLAELGIDGSVDEAAFHSAYPIPGRFDLVLFSHSLYWMADPVGCVQHAREALSPGGCVLAFLQGPFGVHSMYRVFDPLFERDRPPGPNHGFSSAELVSGLRDAGLAPEVVFDPTPFDLTGLFDAENDRERDEFLSFCLQVEFSELHEPVRTDVLAYLRAACVEQDGRLLWYEPTATVVVAGESAAIGLTHP